MYKRIIAIGILLLLAGLTGWLIIEASEPEALPEGSAMPEINFTIKSGNDILKQDSTRQTIVVYFNSRCEHCKYELSELNKNIDKFSKVRIFLFTTEKNFFKAPVVSSWNKLYTTKNIFFGIVDRTEYENKFGSMVTPSIFLFDASNKLIKKIRGEIKIENLLKDLRSA